MSNGVRSKIRPFFIDISRKLTLIEYALVDDPGVGDGTQITIDPSTEEIDEVITVATSSLDVGVHDLHVRVFDDQQQVSITNTVDVTICSGARADFSAATACLNTPVQFTDLSINALGTDLYQWDFDGDGTIDDTTVGDVSYAYTSTGTYTATLTLDRDDCVSSKSIEVIVHDLPNVVANASETMICLGEEITLTGSGTDAYTWDNDVIDGVAFTPMETTTFIVTGTDANGCQNTAMIEVVVNIVETPTITVITDDGEHGVVLQSSSPSGNQWFVDGEAVEGATDQTFTIFGPTTLSVQVTDGDCMSEMSEEIYFYVLEVDQKKISNDLKIWPNPAKNKLMIRSDHFESYDFAYKILSSSGQIVTSNEFRRKGLINTPYI